MNTNTGKIRGITDDTRCHPPSVAVATWFESLAVASRPLQRRLAETDLFSTSIRESLKKLLKKDSRGIFDVRDLRHE